jgi:hypothetical protein
MKIKKIRKRKIGNDDITEKWLFVNLFLNYTFLCYKEKIIFKMIRTPTIDSNESSLYFIETEEFAIKILLKY